MRDIYKVFIVEDDLSLQTLYELIIETIGFEILAIANNGEEAVSLFKSFSEKPDLILMDHRMPIKNGIAASKEIFELNEDVNIIFISADISVKKEALDLGVKDFIEKPFSIMELQQKIEKIFNLIKQNTKY